MSEPPDQTFRRFLSEGRFMIQRSRASGTTFFPPRVMAPGTGEQDLEWITPTGRGTVHSFTVVPQRPPREDYNICLVDLEEGPRVLSRIVTAAPAELMIGTPVEAFVDVSGAEPILLFRTRSSAT